MLCRLCIPCARVATTAAALALHTARRGVATSATTMRADALRSHRDTTLVPLLTAKKAKLAELEAIKQRCDQHKELTGDRYMFAIYLFMVAQAVVLFDWTFIHFDWTLTEPITYLLGYSATWIGLWWYGNMQREFSFDNFRTYVTTQRREKLYKTNKLDIKLYEQLCQDVSQLEARVAALRTV